MSTKNPEYNPDWEEVHGFHKAEFDRLSNIPFDDITNEQRKEKEHHLSEQRRCLDTYQHETFAAAARWVFDRFDPTDLVGLDGFVQTIDYNSFASMEEITQSWKDVDNAVRMIKTDKTYSMKAGQPISDDLPNDLFCDIGGNLQTASQIFSNTWFGETEVLTTIDRRDDAIYICFLNSDDGVSVVNAIEQFATTMRHQIAEFLTQEKASQKGKDWKDHSVLSVFQGLRKQKLPELVFFQHIPPMEYREETLSRVDLTLSGNEYSDPKWRELDCIPENLQKVRREKNTKIVSASTMKLIGK
jgi:hypothetical protein